MIKTLLKKPSASQAGINSKAKAEPNVPGALGARPEPKPTPQNTIQRCGQVICLNLMEGLSKMLISVKLKRMVYAIFFKS